MLTSFNNSSDHQEQRGSDDSSMEVGDFIQQKLASRIARSALTECSGVDYIDCVLGKLFFTFCYDWG